MSGLSNSPFKETFSNENCKNKIDVEKITSRKQAATLATVGLPAIPAMLGGPLATALSMLPKFNRDLENLMFATDAEAILNGCSPSIPNIVLAAPTLSHPPTPEEMKFYQIFMKISEDLQAKHVERAQFNVWLQEAFNNNAFLKSHLQTNQSFHTMDITQLINEFIFKQVLAPSDDDIPRVLEILNVKFDFDHANPLNAKDQFTIGYGRKYIEVCNYADRMKILLREPEKKAAIYAALGHIAVFNKAFTNKNLTDGNDNALSFLKAMTMAASSLETDPKSMWRLSLINKLSYKSNLAVEETVEIALTDLSMNAVTNNYSNSNTNKNKNTTTIVNNKESIEFFTKCLNHRKAKPNEECMWCKSNKNFITKPHTAADCNTIKKKLATLVALA